MAKFRMRPCSERERGKGRVGERKERERRDGWERRDGDHGGFATPTTAILIRHCANDSQKQVNNFIAIRSKFNFES